MPLLLCRIRNHYQVLQGSEVPTKEFKLHISQYLSELGLEPPTAQEIGILRRDALGEGYQKSRSRAGNVYVRLHRKRAHSEGGFTTPICQDDLEAGTSEQTSQQSSTSKRKNVAMSSQELSTEACQVTIIDRLQEKLERERELRQNLEHQLYFLQQLTSQLQVQLANSVQSQVTHHNLVSILEGELDIIAHLDDVMHSPLDSDSISSLAFSSMREKVQRHAPLLSGLVFKLGKSEASSSVAVSDVQSMTVLAILCRKRNVRASWLQHLVPSR